MRIKLFLYGMLFLSSSLSAQIKSPNDFLGYQPGSRFTPHYKIVNYFNQAAASMSSMMKLEKYGETNEGRELLLAFVSSPDNISRLEEIRKNNLRLTGLLKDRPGEINAPAIIWLSYNVHGDEASSSEAAMKTLYELLNPANGQTKEWLKNTVIIIDPCINPDGRDRYVNWVNGVLGKNPNANPNSREHTEPWPYGRSNHYNFDLNRDWAWQTQVETQQRMKKYNEWMPQVHCDYHEMGPEDNYYFAPAAEPLHELITPWQREFQITIGTNHAKYFDANGWLYFTKEYYDLFYPSYGDTYPTLNGAIGITYEQAGGGAGGLAYLKSDGDTLTLKDRIDHHFTTGMSTIEMSSKNAGRMIIEFKKYFDEAGSKGIGEYKTYIVTSNDNNKLDGLKLLLTNNKIQFGDYSRTGVRGYNYFSGKEELVSTEKYSVAISVVQPKSALIQVLFEPSSKLSDSATYDITAWSLPYAYGLKSYAVKENIAVTNASAANTNVIPASSYGYLVKYNSFNDAKLLASLLQQGVRVRFAEQQFSFRNKNYAKGSLIILRSGNENVFASVPMMLMQYHAEADVVESGMMQTGFDFGSGKIRYIKKPNVAMLTGTNVSFAGAGVVWHLFDQQLNYPITLINADDIAGVNWKNIDVLIMPGGFYKFLADKDGVNDLKTWVKQGGKVIAIENAAAQMAGGDWGFKLKKSDEDSGTKNPYASLRKYENRERDGIVNNIPGAIYKLEMDNSHPLAFGYPDIYFALKLNDNLYEFMKDGWNVGVLKKNNQVAGFVGTKVKEKIKDGTAIGVLSMGSGSVIFFGDDPVFRSFWENGKLLLANAVFLVGQ
ncbi:MAG TPA: M14 family metallopeptidase [Ferruginibacter sp.]|nr:M14 family metallopeptidase [Ferruginibacter sp.]